MPSWPATLPQQFIGLTDQIQDPVLRTPMDAGPPTRRKRYTSVTRKVVVPIILTGAQRQTFDTFFNTTLEYGSLAFDWEDPVTDSTVSMAFLEPPTWRLRGGSGTPNTRTWETTMMLEIQP